MEQYFLCDPKFQKLEDRLEGTFSDVHIDTVFNEQPCILLDASLWKRLF